MIEEIIIKRYTKAYVINVEQYRLIMLTFKNINKIT